MAKRTTPLITGEYYHLYNRGNSKQVISHDEHDNTYFIHLLTIMNNSMRTTSRSNKDKQNQEDVVVSIGAYCLMPNHFHILIKQEKDQGASIFMKKVLTGYSMYYNKKYKHSGGLFEGRFKSKHAGEDSYLKYLFSYIHLNPLKIFDKNWKEIKPTGKGRQFLEKYSYSSFSEYATGNFDIVHKEMFPKYFPTKEIFLKEISSWLKIDSANK